MVEHKDVVLGLLAASAALAGLALVFLGLVISAYSGLRRPVPSGTRAPYQRSGAALLAAFGVGLACVVVSTSWLIELGGNRAVYVAVVVLFFAQVASLAGTAVWTSKELLWD